MTTKLEQLRARMYAERAQRETPAYKKAQAAVDAARTELAIEETKQAAAESITVQYLHTMLAHIERGERIPRLLREDTCEALKRERQSDAEVALKDESLDLAVARREALSNNQRS